METAKQHNNPLTGAIEIMKIKEAEASCNLDGETQSCQSCRAKIEADVLKGKFFIDEAGQVIKDGVRYYPESKIKDIETETRQKCWEDFKKLRNNDWVIGDWEANELKYKWLGDK
jgi:hypothetical protein